MDVLKKTAFEGYAKLTTKGSAADCVKGVIKMTEASTIFNAVIGAIPQVGFSSLAF